jgi:hypothetical protein
MAVSIRLDQVPTKDAARYLWHWTVLRDGEELGSGDELHLKHAADAARLSDAMLAAMRRYEAPEKDEYIARIRTPPIIVSGTIDCASTSQTEAQCQPLRFAQLGIDLGQ